MQGRKAFAPRDQALLFTFGGSYKHHTFDMLRDRLDLNAATGAVVPATNLILPSKYFPKSDVGETGAYVQAEMRLGRLTLVPGVRYDRFSLDADGNDRGLPRDPEPGAGRFLGRRRCRRRLGAAVRVSNAVTLHAQYAGGFRAPPYSAINSGFTNLLGGYTSMPNTDLDAETSDNVEVGVRAAIGRVSVGVTGFSNHYDDFIHQVQRGVNPATGLLEFQYQNVSKVDDPRHRAARRGPPGATRCGCAPATPSSAATTSRATHDVPLNTIAPGSGRASACNTPRARIAGAAS